MVEIIRAGVARLPRENAGTEAEMNEITDPIPGDKFYVEDTANGTMLAGYFYTTGWRKFETYDV